MASPYLTIDLNKIEHNSRTIVSVCQSHGISVTGVTKGVCGQPEVAKAMLRGGVSSLADSRMENIHRLQAAGIHTRYMLLRLPPLSEVEEVVGTIDVSVNSEIAVAEALSQAACRRGMVHDVMLMVELGDLREGIPPDQLLPFVRAAMQLSGIRIQGIGTNLACFGGVVPSTDNMARLVELATAVEELVGYRLEWISGMNSSGLDLLVAGETPMRINHARIGEAILLGRETVHRRPWPGTFQDAFLLHAEILELKKKPSLPVGTRSEDAFGELPEYQDRGEMIRALLNVGREDVVIEGMTPLDSQVTIVGASSGYLVVDVTRTDTAYGVGDELIFSLNYAALLRVSTSEYVKKRPFQAGVRSSDA
ncbi:MAG: alanine/ornithine racemase family PLP-dependent enzyme [Nitrospirota bacterium]|nr:alanine/ornithine racemase family PLP-dependent enzyme [Nitrospirota bacterium]MDH4360558.1 alanine/ornithine racemase family PLP-dependent enzyme [Nitrospirota bacterium]